MNSAPALELGVRVQRTGGSTCGSSRHHWLAGGSRGLDSLHNWLAASEGGGRGPVVRIGRVQEEEEGDVQLNFRPAASPLAASPQD